MKKIFKVFIVLIITAMLLVLYAVEFERYNVKVEEITFKSSKIHNDIKMVHLSDLHILHYTDYEDKVLKKVNALNPDVIVITGDFFPGSDMLEMGRRADIRKNIEYILKFVTGLKSKYGIWVSRGNDDFSNDIEISDLLPEALLSKGVHVFTSTGGFMPLGTDTLFAAGLDYTGYNIRDVADLVIKELEGNKIFESHWSRKNAYSHLADLKDESQWHDYTYTGRFRQTRNKKSGVGITFYSQMHKGFDKFYRLRQTGEGNTFQFSPHGTRVQGDSLDTGFSPRFNRWVNFKIQCRTFDAYTETRAKVWYESSTEPTKWMAVARDSSNSRLKAGSIGLWTAGMGDRQYDDLCVTTLAGDTLLFEDFEAYSLESDPPGWLDFGYPEEVIPFYFKDLPDRYLSLLLAHTPSYVYEADKYNVDLMLSGHTHGGQIRMPFVGPVYNNTTMNKRYMKGLHKFEHTTLYVTRGIGTVLVPARTFCPPEITLIHLKAE